MRLLQRVDATTWESEPRIYRLSDSLAGRGFDTLGLERDDLLNLIDAIEQDPERTRQHLIDAWLPRFMGPPRP